MDWSNMSELAAHLGNSIWVYPWDLFDDGIDIALDRIAHVGLNSISVTATYHAVRVLMPHNPRRKVLTDEPDAAYFAPDANAYPISLAPRLASEFSRRDPLAEICAAALNHNLRVQAWTIFLHNSTLGTQHPELTITNCFGDHYVHALCPSNPTVRAYAIALGADITRRYPIAALDVEALAFMGYAHNSHHDKASIGLGPLHHFLLSVCFCPHCTQHIEQHGASARVIAETFRRELQAYFDGDRHFAALTEREGLVALLGEMNTRALLDARNAIILSLLAELRRAVPKNIALILRVASAPFHVGGKTAGDLNDLAQHTDGMTFTFFSLPFAKFKSEVSTVPREILRARDSWAGVSLGMDLPECQDENDFRARIDVLRTQGFEQFAFYNYGLMPRPCLDWIARWLNQRDEHSPR
jgi:hypothetical protein